MAKRKPVNPEAILEKYRTTPEQHCAEYLRLAPQSYTAQYLLRLVADLTPRNYVLIQTDSVHAVTIESAGAQVTVRTNDDFGKTEMTLVYGDRSSVITATRELPLHVVARMLDAAIDEVARLS